MSDSSVIIRPAQGGDCAELLRMMYQLALFEGYAEHFVVTEDELNKRLFINHDFNVLVAKIDNQLIGMLVYYPLPFTYDLKPWIYIKELFIDSEYRSMNIGKSLMTALATECIAKGYSKIRWDVLSSNNNAKKFYTSLGAIHEEEWCLFILKKDGILSLAKAE